MSLPRTGSDVAACTRTSSTKWLFLATLHSTYSASNATCFDAKHNRCTQDVVMRLNRSMRLHRKDEENKTRGSSALSYLFDADRFYTVTGPLHSRVWDQDPNVGAYGTVRETGAELRNSKVCQVGATVKLHT